jgi:hypothetical protein
MTAVLRDISKMIPVELGTNGAGKLDADALIEAVCR